MKNTIRQVVVSLTVLVTIIINILADVLPINGLNTGKISDSFHVYFVPAGYVFAIWGIIYIGLIAYAIYQALPVQRENPRLQSTGWWVVLGGLANSIWIFLWHYEQFVGTLGAMLILLATLIAVYLHLGIGQTKVTTGETWAVRIPFSIYLGWITVATVANVTDVLDGGYPGRSAGDRRFDELPAPGCGLCPGDPVGAGRHRRQIPAGRCCHRRHLGHLWPGGRQPARGLPDQKKKSLK